MPDTENGRVTLAVVSTKLDAMALKLDDMIGLFRKHCEDNDETEERVTRLEGRVNAWQAFQGVYTTLTAVVAGWLGMRH